MIDSRSSAPSTARYAAITLLYVAVVVVGAIFMGFFDPSGRPLSPHEWGDVLAGVFSPLAFLWLIYASLSQRAELELQREELSRNNETQEQQQLQMRRQADALEAQIARIEAQSFAAYQPVLVGSSGQTTGLALTDYRLHNVGAAILDVELQGGAIADRMYTGLEFPGRSIGSSYIGYWPKDHTVVVSVAKAEDAGDFLFRIHFQRSDSLRYTNAYAISSDKRRLRLLASLPD